MRDAVKPALRCYRRHRWRAHEAGPATAGWPPPEMPPVVRGSGRQIDEQGRTERTALAGVVRHATRRDAVDGEAVEAIAVYRRAHVEVDDRTGSDGTGRRE